MPNKELIDENRRKYVNETRKWLKEHHFCRECYKKDVYTLAGRTKCAECATKEAESKRQKRANNAEYRQAQLDSHKKWAQKKADEGLCVHCGKRKTDGKHKTCIYCREKIRLARAERQETETNYPRGENGYCWQCNKKMAMPGYRLCQECYNKKVIVSMENLGLIKAI